MPQLSKRYRALAEKVGKPAGPIPLADGLKLLKQFGTTKFNQTVEVSTNLGIDPKHRDLPVDLGLDLREADEGVELGQQLRQCLGLRLWLGRCRLRLGCVRLGCRSARRLPFDRLRAHVLVLGALAAIGSGATDSGNGSRRQPQIQGAQVE